MSGSEDQVIFLIKEIIKLIKALRQNIDLHTWVTELQVLDPLQTIVSLYVCVFSFS